MKSKFIFFVSLLMSVFSYSEPKPAPVIKRFSFIVGENNGGSSKTRLKYAAQDALSIARVMEELGGVESDDSIVTINPNRSDLLSRIQEMKAMIRKGQQPNVRTELLFYYSGHSDDEGLLLGNDRLSYQELKSLIRNLSADLSILILDSCASGNLTRIKGGNKARPFLHHALSKLRGYVALTSSSSDEVAQESDRIQGSYFTHYLVSGLRGAADLSSRNRVTLNEAYQYAYNQTLAHTERTARGAQHPSYSIQLTGSGELVMTDLRRVSAKIIFDKDVLGRVFIRDKNEIIVAEVDKVTPKPIAIGLEAGDYSLISFKDRQIGKAQVKLAENRVAQISAANFTAVDAEPTTARGSTIETSIIEEDLIHVPAEFSFVPGLSTNVFPPEKTTNNFSFNVIYSQPVRVSGFAWSLLGGTMVRDSASGVMLSPFFNTVETSMSGVQIAIGHNRASQLRGTQLGFGYNDATETVGAQIGSLNHSQESLTGAQVGVINHVEKTVKGSQIGGLLNHSTETIGFQLGGMNFSENISGAQLGGLANWSKDTKGIQLAALNIASRIDGVQIGAANVASDINGMQLGAVNYGAGEEGITVGLLNLPRRGQLRLNYAYDDLGLHQIAVKYGTRYTYSFLQYGTKNESGTSYHAKSFGLGGDIPWHRISFNIETLVMRLDKNSFINNDAIWAFQTRLGPRYRLTNWFAIFAQGSFNVGLTQYRQDFVSVRDLYFWDAHPAWIGYHAGLEFLL